MKRRIRSIFVLMTLCILGINFFQGYWLYTTYTLHKQQFTRIAMEALLSALQQQQDANARQLFRIDNKIPPGEKPPRVFYKKFKQRLLTGDVLIQEERQIDSTETISYFDSIIERPDIDVLGYYRSPAFERSAFALPPDTLARRISSRIIVNWFNEHTPFDLVKMDSVYQRELVLRQVPVEYTLDTLRPKFIKAGFPEFQMLPTKEYPIQMHPIPVNPVHQIFLQASFKNPALYILQKMSWLLAGSFVLLVFTTGCFLYMLSTILTQKKLSEVKSDFINNMTHELKTPIATVSAAVEAMLSFGALENASKTQLYLTVSRNELQRLSDLVEKVMNIAIEEKQELVLHLEAINPAELITDIVTHYQLKAAKTIDFSVEFSPESQLVHADRLHLANTLHNLIDNAIKYSHQQVSIFIKSSYRENGWFISVKDNGIGIAKSYHQAIFERFFRVPTGNLHQVKGFGLGLSYVKQVVEKHGGSIEVQSEPHTGSEFILWFPANKLMTIG